MKYDYMRNTTNSNINPLSLAIPRAIENGGRVSTKENETYHNPEKNTTTVGHTFQCNSPLPSQHHH